MTPLQTYLLKVIEQCELPIQFQSLKTLTHQIESLPDKQVTKSLKTLSKMGHISFEGDMIDRPQG